MQLLSVRLLLSSATIGLSIQETAGQQHDAVHDLSTRNSSHFIFNAVHHAMRQFGSSLDHNGMSMFLATVPAGTEFYHGDQISTPISGPEWLAFEPEHAMIFARGLRHRPPPSEGDGQPGSSSPSGSLQIPLAADGISHPHWRQRRATPNPENENDDEHWDKGYLHTFRTKRPLRLIYVDGQGAAKSAIGTLDVQDIVLRNGTNVTSLQPEPAQDQASRQFGSTDEDFHSSAPNKGPMNEGGRAEDICTLASQRWQGMIDGILRMEGGFEVILCSFEAALQPVSVNAVVRPRRMKWADLVADEYSYIHAVAARYDGIGGDRVALDFEGMINMFAYPGAVYIDETGRPRVATDVPAVLEVVRQDVQRMLVETGDPAHSFNWQGVTDMVVTRYADMLEYLTSGSPTSLQGLQSELGRFMRPYVDAERRSFEAETDRCTAQFLPSRWATPAVNPLTVPAQAVKEVIRDICSTLTDVSLSASSLEEALISLHGLRERLAWTTWKRCRGCGPHEFCVVPMWPAGSKEIFERPKCSNGSDVGEGYWD